MMKKQQVSKDGKYVRSNNIHNMDFAVKVEKKVTPRRMNG
jgi:hypothetical protein